MLLLIGLAFVGFVELGVRALPLHELLQGDDDPYVGFSEVHPLFVLARDSVGRETMETSRNKLRWFNYQSFTRQKEPGVFRIFTLGGSTTYGRPYADRTSFSGWLRFLLESDRQRERSYEVINAGGISYASYRVVLLLEELLGYEPDLFVIYTGHNEFLEARTYGNFTDNESSIISTVQNALRKLETYRLLDAVFRKVRSGSNDPAGTTYAPATMLEPEVNTLLNRSAGLDLYHRDSTFSSGVFVHFDYNIRKIISLCEQAGVPVLFLEPVDNLRDFSPFKSEEDSRLDAAGRQKLAGLIEEGRKLLDRGDNSLAVDRFRRAVATDSLYAEGHYYLGASLLASGDTAGAARCFLSARELDVCPLRARQPIHDILRKHTAAKRRADLLDLPRLFGSNSPGGITGGETLIDHIHPFPQGHLWIAREILDWMREEGMVRQDYTLSDKEADDIYNREMSVLPDEYFRDGLINLAKVLMWARKFSEAITVLESRWDMLQEVPQGQYLMGAALEQTGRSNRALEYLRRANELETDNLVTLNMLGRVYSRLGRKDSSRAVYGRMLERFPDDPEVLSEYGTMLSISGEDELALSAFERARRLKPDMPGIYTRIGMVHYRNGDYAKALEAYRWELEVSPAEARPYYNLARVYARMDSVQAAEKLYLEALRRQPDNLQVYIGLARFYKESGRSGEARKVARDGLDIFPDSKTLRLLLRD